MIQYIQVETDEKGKIIGLAFVDSKVGAYSNVKKILSETSGLPEDASTKDHIAKIAAELSDPYFLAKQKLAAESGLEDCCTTEEHIAAIKSKARLRGLDNGRKYPMDILAKHSGLDQSNAVNEHIASIKHTAWCEGAKLKRQELQDILSDHSGLVPSNEVSAHIAAIKLKAYDQGYDKGWHDKQADLQKRIKQFEEAITKEVLNERETE